MTDGDLLITVEQKNFKWIPRVGLRFDRYESRGTLQSPAQPRVVSAFLDYERIGPKMQYMALLQLAE